MLLSSGLPSSAAASADSPTCSGRDVAGEDSTASNAYTAAAAVVVGRNAKQAHERGQGEGGEAHTCAGGKCMGSLSVQARAGRAKLCMLATPTGWTWRSLFKE